MRYQLSDNTWDQKEFAVIQEVLDSNMFSMGRRVAQYEAEFAEKFGVKYALMVSSGSAANLLAVAGLVYSGRLKRGDEVIVPAVSWSTTYFPLYQMGLKLRFVDIDKDTLNIDADKFAEAVTGQTRLVCLVNLLGNPNEFEKIAKVCDKKNILIMEDNCESLGAEYHGKKAGTLGLVGTFSTFYSHHLCTMEGGMVVTDDEELYHYMLCSRAHGWTRNLPKDSPIYKKSEVDFYESFNFIVPGFNLRPLEIEGAAGSEQLKKMDRIIARRRKNAEYFREKMRQFEDVRIQKEIGESSWFGFAVILGGGLRGRRDEIVRAVAGGGIEVRPIVAGNFTRNSVIKYLDFSISGELTASDDIHDNGFFIGNHSKDNSAEIDYFAGIFGGALEKLRGGY
ncbi:MAG: DegT/DnrJ/EryC1/StrS family aminotransferase [Lachnospiraceae bacterium]|nr:DegT/DnrJ/EryC1/StrS family aminotransferase [Lachnospiraceae bacterium]